MTVQIKNPKAKWYVELMQKFENLMQALGIPENASNEIKTFILEISREQYMAGNKSGIRWQRVQAGLPVRS